MEKNRTAPKLTLNRETLKSLDKTLVSGVVGGDIITSFSANFFRSFCGCK